MVGEGDIVEIPLPDNRVALGWVLHRSTRFQNAFGFVVFGIKGQTCVDAVFSDDSGDPKPMSILGPLYTHSNAIKHYSWRTVGHQPVSNDKRALTRRIVGGGVYIADEFIGPADTYEQKSLPKMLAMGMRVVYARIGEAFPHSD